MEAARASRWLNLLVGLAAGLGLAFMLWLGWSAPPEPPAEEAAAPTLEPTAAPAADIVSRPARPMPPVRRGMRSPGVMQQWMLINPGAITRTLQLQREGEMPINPGLPTAPMPVLPGEKTVPMPATEPAAPSPAPQPAPSPTPQPTPAAEPVS